MGNARGRRDEGSSILAAFCPRYGGFWVQVLERFLGLFMQNGRKNGAGSEPRSWSYQDEDPPSAEIREKTVLRLLFCDFIVSVVKNKIISNVI